MDDIRVLDSIHKNPSNIDSWIVTGCSDTCNYIK